MKEYLTVRTARFCLFLSLFAFVLPGLAPGFELENGIYDAGVIQFPTARDQPTDHTLHANIEITDIAEPELSVSNLRYGLQMGSFQLLGDFNWTLEPRHEFDYGEVKAKLQVLNLEEFRTAFAVGLLVRFVADAEERLARIDDRTVSLFGISTFELFPFDQWGGVLINFYLDNRFANFGFKFQIYQSVQWVGELDYLHTTLRDEKIHGRSGVSFEGLQNFYFQILWADVGAHFQVQFGTGF